jgi:hypothetical protein
MNHDLSAKQFHRLRLVRPDCDLLPFGPIPIVTISRHQIQGQMLVDALAEASVGRTYINRSFLKHSGVDDVGFLLKIIVEVFNLFGALSHQVATDRREML